MSPTLGVMPHVITGSIALWCRTGSYTVVECPSATVLLTVSKLDRPEIDYLIGLTRARYDTRWQFTSKNRHHTCTGKSTTWVLTLQVWWMRRTTSVQYQGAEKEGQINFDSVSILNGNTIQQQSDKKEKMTCQNVTWVGRTPKTYLACSRVRWTKIRDFKSNFPVALN